MLFAFLLPLKFLIFVDLLLSVLTFLYENNGGTDAFDVL